jgi:hypothetical protein
MLDKLMGKAGPIGMAVSAAGGIMNVIGAIGQKKEAERQMYAQEAFGKKQRESFKTGYADLLSQAKNLSTYQGDISRYTKLEQAAQETKRAAGAGQVAGEGIMREQARQTTANTLAAAQRGATSSSDLLTAALMGQQQEGAQMQNIDIQSQQQRQQMQQQAQQNYLYSLGQTAAAQAQQAGLQFQSESAKQQQLLGLTESQFKEGMNLEDQLFGQEQAKAAAVQNAKSAIWSGIGGIASGIGGGLMQMQQGADQMGMLKLMYPSGVEQGVKNFFAPKEKLGLGAMFGSKQLTTGFPSTNVNPYQAPMVLAPQAQTNYSGLVKFGK